MISDLIGIIILLLFLVFSCLIFYKYWIKSRHRQSIIVTGEKVVITGSSSTHSSTKRRNKSGSTASVTGATHPVGSQKGSVQTVHLNDVNITVEFPNSFDIQDD